MPKLIADIPESLAIRLSDVADRCGKRGSLIVAEALAAAFDETLYTVFQISNSGPLVTGTHKSTITVNALLALGDFGLGTLEDFDRDMIVLDGKAYRVSGIAEASEANGEDATPFALVTRFNQETVLVTPTITNLRDLCSHCDDHRRSGNIFYALRLDGRFDRVKTQSESPPTVRSRLTEPEKSHGQIELTHVTGTLIGIWSPGFASAFSLPGYHFCFISEDRRRGGRLIECAARALRLRIGPLTSFHLATPETEAYLATDLSMNTAAELAYVEQNH